MNRSSVSESSTACSFEFQTLISSADFLLGHGVTEAVLNNVDPVEAATNRSLRWWRLEELAAAKAERFVPATLAHDLRLLLLHGPPESPRDVGA